MPSDASPLEKIENPWLRAFLADPWEETVLGQLIIRRKGMGFELRHKDDLTAENLKSIGLAEVRQLANFTADGKFRPLKSTPDLRSGWILSLQSPEDLEAALQTIYPNALADLYTFRNGTPPVTSYRDFTNRQTGMYRITTFLSDSDVARVIDNVCNTICIKYRLWPIEASSPTALRPSIAPVCLEPCAIFLETARKEVRAMQEKSAPVRQAESSSDPS
jgi:hypothetical protein